MADELKPCPFCGGADIYSDYCEAAGVWEVQCNECGARRFNVKRKDEAEARWNTRYERTCHVVSSRDYWDEYERYVTHVGWRLSCGHETITEGRDDPGDPSSSRPCFCSACGAEVADGD